MISTIKINLFAPDPKGSKLIFNTPFRDGAMLKISISPNTLFTLKLF